MADVQPKQSLRHRQRSAQTQASPGQFDPNHLNYRAARANRNAHDAQQVFHHSQNGNKSVGGTKKKRPRSPGDHGDHFGDHETRTRTCRTSEVHLELYSLPEAKGESDEESAVNQQKSDAVAQAETETEGEDGSGKASSVEVQISQQKSVQNSQHKSGDAEPDAEPKPSSAGTQDESETEWEDDVDKTDAKDVAVEAIIINAENFNDESSLASVLACSSDTEAEEEMADNDANDESSLASFLAGSSDTEAEEEMADNDANDESSLASVLEIRDQPHPGRDSEDDQSLEGGEIGDNDDDFDRPHPMARVPRGYLVHTQGNLDELGPGRSLETACNGDDSILGQDPCQRNTSEEEELSDEELMAKRVAELNRLYQKRARLNLKIKLMVEQDSRKRRTRLAARNTTNPDTERLGVLKSELEKLVTTIDALEKFTGWSVYSTKKNVPDSIHGVFVKPQPLADNEPDKNGCIDHHHGTLINGQSPGMNCVIDGVNKSVGIGHFLKVKDLQKAHDLDPQNAGKEMIKSLPLAAVALERRLGGRYSLHALYRSHGRTPMHVKGEDKLNSFFKLFQKTQGIYVFSTLVRGGEFGVGHCASYNAGANLVMDGNSEKAIIIHDSDRALSPEDLEAKVKAEFGYYQLECVYVVKVKKCDVENGLVKHYIG